MWSYLPETTALRAICAFATALILSLLCGGKLIAFLKGREKGGQPIRDDGPKTHIEEKKGTPTMGGILILATSLIAMLIFANVKQHFVWISMLYGGLSSTSSVNTIFKPKYPGLMNKSLRTAMSGLWTNLSLSATVTEIFPASLTAAL